MPDLITIDTAADGHDIPRRVLHRLADQPWARADPPFRHRRDARPSVVPATVHDGRGRACFHAAEWEAIGYDDGVPVLTLPMLAAWTVRTTEWTLRDRLRRRQAAPDVLAPEASMPLPRRYRRAPSGADMPIFDRRDPELDAFLRWSTLFATDLSEVTGLAAAAA